MPIPQECAGDPVLRLAALLRGPAGPVAAALRLSRAEAEQLAVLLADRPVPLPGFDDAALRRMLADEPVEMLLGRGWLRQDGGDPAGWAVVCDRLRALEAPAFPLAGRDLLASGLPAGPAVGRLLAATREWWLRGGCVACRDECLSHARGLARQAGLLPD